MAVQFLNPSIAMAISTAERDFFVSMGGRIAALRKLRNITQVQLAQALGVSQQTMPSYEVGRRRIPVSALPTVASTLSVLLEELFGQAKQAARAKRGPVSALRQHVERIEQLPKPKQKFVLEMLQTVLAGEAR